MTKAIDPTKLARTLRRIDRVKESIEIATVEELRRSSEEIVSVAKSLVPVGETGDLQRSIRWEFTENEYETVIGTNIEYAPFVEFGTRNKAARPFLFPAYKYVEPQFRQTLGMRISNELKKVRNVL